MRIEPRDKKEAEKAENEVLLQKRLALLFVFGGVFVFFFKILFF